MRLLQCLSCVLGFAGWSTLEATDVTTTGNPTNAVTFLPNSATLKTEITAVTTKEAFKATSGTTTVGLPSSNQPTPTSAMKVLSMPASVLPSPGSSLVLGSSPTTMSPVNTLTSISSKSTGISVSGSLPSPTATAANLPPSSNGGTTAPSVTIESLVNISVTHPGTSAGPSTPGSSSTERAATTATTTPPAGLPTTAGPSPVPMTSRTTPENTATSTASKATSTASGASLTETPPASTNTTMSTTAVSSSTAPLKSTKTPPVTGDVPIVSGSPITSQASGLRSTASPMTANSQGIKMSCATHDFANTSLIVLKKEKEAISCADPMVWDHKFLTLLCDSVKSGFKFNNITDKCSVQLGYSKEHPKNLAVLEVSVKANAAAKDMDENLKNRAEELKKLGFVLANDTGSENKPHEDIDDKLSIPLIITIVCLAGALLLTAAIYSCCHQRQRHKKDQRLTEELQTMENGYHDNPTLDVMETSPEMQEKKPGLNGDLGDSWIVPMDNLTREDLDEEEEDTHL